MIPKHVAEVLPSDPKHKEVVTCLKEKTHASLDKLYLGMSYSVMGYMFNVNESIIYTYIT